MSDRSMFLVGAALLILVVRFFATGRIGKAWAKLWGPGPGRPSMQQGSSPGGGGFVPAAQGGGSFGLTGVTAVLHPTAYLSQDRGLVPNASGEVNYMLPTGAKEPVALPKGTTWTLLKRVMNGQVGGEELWRDASGGLLGFLHLSNLGPYQAGQTVKGGTTVAVSGWPIDPAYGFGVAGPTNAHLAVVYDPQTARYV